MVRLRGGLLASTGAVALGFARFASFGRAPEGEAGAGAGGRRWRRWRRRRGRGGDYFSDVGGNGGGGEQQQQQGGEQQQQQQQQQGGEPPALPNGPRASRARRRATSSPIKNGSLRPASSRSTISRRSPATIRRRSARAAASRCLATAPARPRSPHFATRSALRRKPRATRSGSPRAPMVSSSTRACSIRCARSR
jgi:hypothetical protein